jgi:hypothetical protein
MDLFNYIIVQNALQHEIEPKPIQISLYTQPMSLFFYVKHPSNRVLDESMLKGWPTTLLNSSQLDLEDCSSHHWYQFNEWSTNAITTQSEASQLAQNSASNISRLKQSIHKCHLKWRFKPQPSFPLCRRIETDLHPFAQTVNHVKVHRDRPWFHARPISDLSFVTDFRETTLQTLNFEVQCST